MAGFNKDKLKKYDFGEQAKFAFPKRTADVDREHQNTQRNSLGSDASGRIKQNRKIKSTQTKRQNKGNRKRRLLSESLCDEMKSSEISVENNDLKVCTYPAKIDESNYFAQDFNAVAILGREYRFVPESRGNERLKGILKHTSRYERSIPESFSSINASGAHGLSTSSKKTVRFNDVIEKHLFRVDSGVLGQRKINQKRKCQKQSAFQRRNSEGDSTDYGESSLSSSWSCKNNRININKASNKSRKDDSKLSATDSGQWFFGF